MCEKNRAKEHIKNKYEPLTEDEKQKQKYKDHQKKYGKNITDEQKKKKKKIEIIKKNIEKI